jgi:hypothetical protein
MTFAYEDVGRDYEKRTTMFEFPDVDGGYVQDNGFGPRKYPLRCYFWGDDHDLAAVRFEQLLLDRGTGRLEHPFYGTLDVVPFGSISRRDDLKTAANQSVIEVTFYTTIGAIYPSAQNSPTSEIHGSLEAFTLAAADQFEAVSDVRSAVAQANLKSTVRKLLREVSAALDVVSKATAAVRREFADALDAIHFGIDVLVGQPLQLAQQIVNLILVPARAAAGIRSRFDAYALLVERILNSAAGRGLPEISPLPRIRLRAANDFAVADLFALSAVSGLILSGLDNTFTTKPEALNAIDVTRTEFDEVVTWRDTRFTELGEIDPGGSYQALADAIARMAGYLIEASFQLVPERRIVLDRPRTIIDLTAELYGRVDDRLDFLIDTNQLTGSEILELSRGRSIVYYT